MSEFLNFDERNINARIMAKGFTKNDQFFGAYYPELESMNGAIAKAGDAGAGVVGAFAYGGLPASTGDTPSPYTDLAGAAHGNYRNYVYGKQLWAQMNIRPTVFTAIPRNQYIKSAMRILNDFATGAIVPNAIKEYASRVPDTKVPIIQSLRVEPRVIINDPYSMTLAQQALDGLDDTVNFDAILEVLQTEFSMRVNGQMLMRNYNAGYNPVTDTDANRRLVNYSYFIKNEAALPEPMGIPLAPLDNLISSKAEYDYLVNTLSADATQAAQAVDLFNMDRHTAASNLDSFVDMGAGVARPLSVDILDRASMEVMPFWKNNTMDEKVIITGFDTVGRLQQLHYQYQRFIGYGNYQTTYNGVKTCPGDVVGFGASQFKGIPIIPDYMVTKEFDAGAVTGLSRMYLMDTNTVHHAVLIPPTFIQDKTYLARRALTDVATYYMASQQVCTKPRANAKIMLLK